MASNKKNASTVRIRDRFELMDAILLFFLILMALAIAFPVINVLALSFAIQKEAAEDPEQFLDEDYLDSINQSLTDRYSWLLVRMDDKLYYNGSGFEDATIADLLTALPIYRSFRSAVDGGSYIGGDIQAFVKQFDLEQADGRRESIFIVSSVSRFLSHSRDLLGELVVSVVVILFITATMLTFWIYLLPVTPLIEDRLLATIFGGVLSGVGIGLVFSTMATTGGSDLFSALLHDKWRHLSIPRILSITDGIIVFLGLFIFDIENVIYSIIVVYLVAKISDSFLDGLKFAKMVYIISDKAEDIAAEVLVAIDRGVTGIKVKGMYSGEDKKMLFCVVGKKQVVELTDIVTRTDKRAFMVVADAREVLGEGFAEVKKTN